MRRPVRCRRLAAAIATFAARTLAHRRLSWAVLAEPVDPEVGPVRIAYRKTFVAEIEARLAAAIAAHHMPQQDVALGSCGRALIEGLIGPLALETLEDPAKARDAAQVLALLALRGSAWSMRWRAGWSSRRWLPRPTHRQNNPVAHLRQIRRNWLRAYATNGSSPARMTRCRRLSCSTSIGSTVR